MQGTFSVWFLPFLRITLECHCAGELRCKVCVAALDCQLFVKATSAVCYFCSLLLLHFASFAVCFLCRHTQRCDKHVPCTCAIAWRPTDAVKKNCSPDQLSLIVFPDIFHCINFIQTHQQVRADIEHTLYQLCVLQIVTADTGADAATAYSGCAGGDAQGQRQCSLSWSKPHLRSSSDFENFQQQVGWGTRLVQAPPEVIIRL